MTNSNQSNIDFEVMVERLGQGVLLFDSDNRLVLENAAARTILGANLTLVRAEGWSACAMLLDARKISGPGVNEIRAQALRQSEPVRFHTLLAGAYTPCWAAGILGKNGELFTMISIEQPDWSSLNELMSTFREEAREAIDSTAGHAELIKQIIGKGAKDLTIEQFGKRIVGFADIIATQMHRLQVLVDLLQRLENIRTGQLIEHVRRLRRRILLADFVEDFLEELSDKPLTDPNRKEDLRDRLSLEIPGKLAVAASPIHVKSILKDLLRNAVLYSAPGSPILLRASKTHQGNAAQLDIIDQGYGIRAKEADRVFAAFQRARQPQVIAEFGYGLSLYLAKSEIEAMGGRIWYESEEGVGSTFSIKLPLWSDSTSR